MSSPVRRVFGGVNRGPGRWDDESYGVSFRFGSRHKRCCHDDGAGTDAAHCARVVHGVTAPGLDPSAPGTSGTAVPNAARTLSISVESDSAMKGAGNDGPSSSILAPSSCVLDDATVTARGGYTNG